jgi:hypothetical protein
VSCGWHLFECLCSYSLAGNKLVNFWS